MKRTGFIEHPDGGHTTGCATRAPRRASSAAGRSAEPDVEGLVRFDLGSRTAASPASRRRHGAAPAASTSRAAWSGRARRRPHPSRQGPYLAARAQPGRQLPGRRHRRRDATAPRAGPAADVRGAHGVRLRCAYAHGTVADPHAYRSLRAAGAQISWPVFKAVRDALGRAGRRCRRARICPLDRFAEPDGERLADIVADAGGILGMVTRLSGGVHDALPRAVPGRCSTASSRWPSARGLDLDLHVDESGETGAPGADRDRADGACGAASRAASSAAIAARSSIQPEEFAQATHRRRRRGGHRHRRPADVQHVPAGPPRRAARRAGAA